MHLKLEAVEAHALLSFNLAVPDSVSPRFCRKSRRAEAHRTARSADSSRDNRYTSASVSCAWKPASSTLISVARVPERAVRTQQGSGEATATRSGFQDGPKALIIQNGPQTSGC